MKYYDEDEEIYPKVGCLLPLGFIFLIPAVLCSKTIGFIFFILAMICFFSSCIRHYD